MEVDRGVDWSGCNTGSVRAIRGRPRRFRSGEDVGPTEKQIEQQRNRSRRNVDLDVNSTEKQASDPVKMLSVCRSGPPLSGSQRVEPEQKVIKSEFVMPNGNSSRLSSVAVG